MALGSIAATWTMRSEIDNRTVAHSKPEQFKAERRAGMSPRQAYQMYRRQCIEKKVLVLPFTEWVQRH